LSEAHFDRGRGLGAPTGNRSLGVHCALSLGSLYSIAIVSTTLILVTNVSVKLDALALKPFVFVHVHEIWVDTAFLRIADDSYIRQWIIEQL